MAAPDDLADAAEHVAPERLVGEAIGDEAKRPGEALRAQREVRALGAGERHGRSLRQRDRQDESVVVVGVLAEQVDPARRARGGVGPAAERGEEAFAQDRLTSTARSSRALSSGSASMA